MDEIESDIDTLDMSRTADPAGKMLELGEEVLEHWLHGAGIEPTYDRIEGFRLLALHRQGAKGDPSFHACRETCRELAFHYNLLTRDPDPAVSVERMSMMKMVLTHIFLFISGKLQTARLGEFCCSSRSLRLDDVTAKS